MLRYIKKIQNIIESLEKTRRLESPKPTQTFSVSISPEFDLIKLELDDTDDLHTHWLILEPDETSLAHKFNIIKYSMPPGLIFNPANTLQEHAETMIHHVNRLSYFTTGLTFIDTYACVVEPAVKSSRDTYRIFKYCDKIYIRVSFDANAVDHDDVLVQFIGPMERTSELQKRYLENKDNWDPDAGLFFNLKKVLEVKDFPEHVEGMASEKDCGVCMEYRDEKDLAPLFSCNNVGCVKQFHHSCVLSWWARQKASNVFHGVLKGQCPGCKTYFELNKTY